VASRTLLIGAAALAVLLGAAWRLSAARRLAGAPHPPAPVFAELRAEAPAFPPDFGVRRVVIDPGHGAAGNAGNVSCFCVEEQVFTLAAAEALRDRLEATGRFEVLLSREGDRLVEYRERLEEAAAWGADAFVSLHSDIRGKADTWSPTPGLTCPVSLVAPGFSILHADDGDAALVDARRALGRALARRMQAAGFLPYDGASYAGLYAADPGAPGVFLDRHAPPRRIFVLQKAAMPSVLIETHHALDPREAERWRDPATLDAFGAAVAAALVDALAPSDLGAHARR
jgi:N-acetylmuramoyl-L-alanine amidase